MSSTPLNGWDVDVDAELKNNFFYEESKRLEKVFKTERLERIREILD